MKAETKSKNCTVVGFILMLTAVATLISFNTAIMIDGNWVFGVNVLSDLGISKVPGVAAIFNYTCMIAGLLTLISSAVKAVRKTGIDRSAAILLAIAGFLLIGVGIFTKAGDLHLPIAITFGVFMMLSLIVGMVADWKNDRKVTAVVGIVIFTICLSCVCLPFPAVEVIAIFFACMWLFAEGISVAFSKA